MSKSRIKSKLLRSIVIILVVIVILALGAAGAIYVNSHLIAGGIEKNIKSGNNLVKQGKFNEAKSAYEKAIDLDKRNKNTYLEIKDNYISTGRLDDAYYIIKIAIKNNVSGISVQLKNISNKFEVTTIKDTCVQNKYYALPKNVTLQLNGKENVLASVTWKNTEVDTKRVGKFEFEGTAENYGRPVKLILTIKAKQTVKKIGYVKHVSEVNGKKYVEIDEVEWYTGEQAVQEAKKDGYTGNSVPNDYYLRDKTHGLITYDVAERASFKLIQFGGSGILLKGVSYSDFNAAVTDRTSNLGPGILCWITISDNIVTDIEEQYTP